MRVLVAGASGYIGRVVVRELLARRHAVTCLLRRPPAAEDRAFADARLLFADLTAPDSLPVQAVGEDPPEAVISCMATRSGGVKDAWAVEYEANLRLLRAAAGRDAVPPVRPAGQVPAAASGLV